MKKVNAMALAACVGALAMNTATAGTPPGAWYIAPQIIGVWVDDGREADDDMGFSLSVGRTLGPRVDGELTYFSSSHDSVGNSEVDLQGLLANLHWVFYRDATVQPYIKTGLGVLEIDPTSGSSEDVLQGVYGVGILADLSRRIDQGTNLQLRGEIYGRTDLDGSGANNERQNDVIAGIGLQYSWGAPIPVATRAAVGDADGDGVTDDIDQCPNTPAGAVVDARGCELDSDGDGVVDRLDKCPGTPAGTKVDADGCPIVLDSDGDGVPDDKDLCPNTRPGTRVGPQGCDCDLTAQLTFRFNSAELTDEDVEILRGVIQTLKELNFTSGVIEGHTDSVGNEAFNQALSERRANAVRDFLVANGISADRMRVVGYGETRPAASNDTAEGRAQNRRVVLRRTDCDEK